MIAAVLGKAVVGAVYRVGADSVRVVYPDGSVTRHGAFALVRFQRHPLRIEGRLYPVIQAHLSYEAPALEPLETK